MGAVRGVLTDPTANLTQWIGDPFKGALAKSVFDIGLELWTAFLQVAPAIRILHAENLNIRQTISYGQNKTRQRHFVEVIFLT